MDLYKKKSSEKISKYIIRLKKSIKNNDKIKVNDYYEHLKYHIQLGGNNSLNDLKELNISFSDIDTIISNITKDNLKKINLDVELRKCDEDKKQLEEEKKKLEQTKIELENKLSDLNLKFEEITKINEELVKNINSQSGEFKLLNDKIDNLQKEKDILEQEIKKISENQTKFENIKKVMNSILGISDDVQLNVVEELEKIKMKLEKYETIIRKIISNADGIDLNKNNKLEKYEMALMEIKSRIDKTLTLEKELEEIKKQNEELNNKIKIMENLTKELETKKNELEKMTKLMEDKDEQIKSLTLELEAEKNKVKNLEKEIDDKTKLDEKIIKEFNSKIKELLEKIYGSDKETINNILLGTKLIE